MTTLRHRSRTFGAASLAGLLLLGPSGFVASHAAAGSAPPPEAAAPPPSPALADALARARLDGDAAQATLASLRRMSEPGHLLDPLPPRLLAGVADLQAQYAELERKAAGYRATLGDQHPTLRGTEEVMADLRRKILEGVRRVLGPAEQEAARARATVATLERQVRAAEATATATATRPAAVPRAAAPRSAASDAPDTAAGVPLAARDPELSPAESDPRQGLLLGTGGVLALAVAIVATLRRRRRVSIPARHEPDPVATGTMPPAPLPAPLPVVGGLALREGDDAGTVRSRLAGGGDPRLASEAAALFATLAAAADGIPGGRVSVAVTNHSASGVADAEALALALASAAADAGRRVLLVDGSREGRLAATLGGDPVAAVVTVGGTVHGMMRVALGARAIVLLAGGAVETGPRVPHLPDLDAFEAIVIAGEGEPAGPLAARFALLTAPVGTDAAALAAPHGTVPEAPGRPCGAVLVAHGPAGETGDASPATPASSRRRLAAEAASARLGLRRTLDPVRRRA